MRSDEVVAERNVLWVDVGIDAYGFYPTSVVIVGADAHIRP